MNLLKGFCPIFSRSNRVIYLRVVFQACLQLMCFASHCTVISDLPLGKLGKQRQLKGLT